MGNRLVEAFTCRLCTHVRHRPASVCHIDVLLRVRDCGVSSPVSESERVCLEFVTRYTTTDGSNMINAIYGSQDLMRKLRSAINRGSRVLQEGIRIHCRYNKIHGMKYHKIRWSELNELVALSSPMTGNQADQR